MQRAAKSDLILISNSSLKDGQSTTTEIVYGRLYQQMATAITARFCKAEDLRLGAEYLVTLADNAYTWRRIDVVARVGSLLRVLPLPPEYESAATYYLALHEKQQGRRELARRMFESVVSRPSRRFVARALQSLGALEFGAGNLDASLALRVEAARVGLIHEAHDRTTVLEAQRMVAAFKGIEGFHHGAVRHLEGLSEAVHSIARWQPYVYYAYLNSLAT